MTENNTNQENQNTNQDGQSGEDSTPTFTQADIDAAVSKAVTAATGDLKEQLKKIQEAKNQQYIVALERETRVNFAQSLLAQNGLPSEQQFAEIYAGFEKDSIKAQIDAQAKLVNDAKEKAKADFAQANMPNKKFQEQGQGSTPQTFTSSRDVLAAKGLI